MTRRNFIATTAASAAMQPPVRCTMGLSPDCFVILRPPRTAHDLLEKAYAVGAGGIQVPITNFEPDYLKKVRSRAEELGMYLEVTTASPGPDTALFEKTLQAAKEIGAGCVRTVCLSGRRYETFNSLEQWKTFVAESMQKFERMGPLANKYKMPVGVENHKDWTAEDYLAILKKYSSEYLGVCLDFGNNVALLDDPMEVVESLAPYVINTHIKDMGVEEYEDGFLLSEVPLGTGICDLKRMVATVLKVRPSAKFSLDFLTRDPLKITCLTEKYWLTFPERNGKYLARSLAMVRKNKPSKPLPRVTGLDREAQLQMEQENVKKSIAYARDHLGLRS
ncbi:MAG: sugar phosphate isomerase/epimerase [Bryobacterales bacterium]|nr:sugar phosphate isomerase/epimerase [Bryobacterales bacterium]